MRIGGWDGEVYGELLVPPPYTSTEEAPGGGGYSLSAWPNPFREHLSVSLMLGESGPVALVVYDLLGREVLRRDLGTLPPGEHTAHLETHTLPAGAYVLRAETGDGVASSPLLYSRVCGGLAC